MYLETRTSNFDEENFNETTSVPKFQTSSYDEKSDHHVQQPQTEHHRYTHDTDGDDDGDEDLRINSLKTRIDAGFKRRKDLSALRQPLPFIYIRNGDFDIVWFNVFVFSLGHLCYFYALYLLLSGQIPVLTYVYCEYQIFLSLRSCIIHFPKVSG